MVRRPFHNTAVDLRNRYYRRFPDAPRERWDLTAIKDRWTRRLQKGRRILADRRAAND